MRLQQIADIIEDLNGEIWERTENELLFLEVSSTGDEHVVQFLSMVIWSTVNDERPYVNPDDVSCEEKVDLETFIRSTVNCIIKNLCKITL